MKSKKIPQVCEWRKRLFQFSVISLSFLVSSVVRSEGLLERFTSPKAITLFGVSTDVSDQDFKKAHVDAICKTDPSPLSSATFEDIEPDVATRSRYLAKFGSASLFSHTSLVPTVTMCSFYPDDNKSDAAHALFFQGKLNSLSRDFRDPKKKPDRAKVLSDLKERTGKSPEEWTDAYGFAYANFQLPGDRMMQVQGTVDANVGGHPVSAVVLRIHYNSHIIEAWRKQQWEEFKKKNPIAASNGGI